MDGNFVDNYQIPIEEILQLEKETKKKLDIHLMVNDPLKYITQLENKKIEYITFHIEIKQNINEIINQIKKLNYKVGIAINPTTNIETIIPYLNIIDLILIMSVEPGKGGQKFIESTINKAIQLKKINKKITIEMDGGINNINIKNIKPYIDIAVVGSYITNNNNYNEAINNLKN